MALVKYDKSIVSIRGQSGGIYFKTGKDGNHIQKMPRYIKYPRSGLQASPTSAWTALSLLAVVMIAAGYLALWVAYAAMWLWKNHVGEWIKLTWWNWFAHYNMKRLAEGEEPMMEPPAGPPLFPPP